jgi:hypothetical protein
MKDLKELEEKKIYFKSQLKSLENFYKERKALYEQQIESLDKKIFEVVNKNFLLEEKDEN